MKISKKWLAMARYFERFARDWPRADFSDEAAQAAYRAETFGEKCADPWNGYLLGKKWMDVTISAWKEDIRAGNLHVIELLNDGYEMWFLKRVGVLP